MNSIRATAVVLNKDNNKLLMIHRFRDGEEYYVLPGGHVEEGEKPEDAAIRELKEETSIEAQFIEKIFEFACKPCLLCNNTVRTHQLFSFKYLSGEPKLMADSGEALAMSAQNSYKPMWVAIEEIPKLTIYPEGTRDFLVSYFNTVKM